MLRMNWKPGGQSRRYSNFNIALGPIGLSIRLSEIQRSGQRKKKGATFMLKLNWKQGGQSRAYSSFNTALGPTGLSIRLSEIQRPREKISRRRLVY